MIQNNNPNIQCFEAKDNNCPLIWNKGSMVNIGDVNSLAVSSNSFNSDDRKDSFVAVIGEGFQIFRLN